jgi:hypothetical protein
MMGLGSRPPEQQNRVRTNGGMPLVGSCCDIGRHLREGIEQKKIFFVDKCIDKFNL